MSRTIEEIDAELAEVDRQIAMRNALGYKMARTRAILDHDTSGLDRVYAALNAAEQNRIAREAQQAFATKQMEAQQAFQTSEREATQKFQGEQNDLNRALQKKQKQENLVIEQAKLLKALQDRYAEWEDVQGQVGISDAKKTSARTAVELARKQALELGVPEKDIEAWKIPTPAGNAEPAGNAAPQSEDLSKQWTVAYNNAKNDIPKLKTAKEVDSYMKGLTDKFGNDASITKELNELVKLAESVKKDRKEKAEVAARVKGMKTAAKKQRDAGMKALAREVYGMLQNKQPIYIPGYDKYPVTAEETLVDGNDAIIRKYGKTPIDTLFFK